MTLLEKDTDWPTRVEVSPFPERMPRTVEVPIDEIVLNGREQWMRKYGREPTDLILGRKACVRLRTWIHSQPGRYFMEHPTSLDSLPVYQMFGMTYHRAWESEGIKIFGDV